VDELANTVLVVKLEFDRLPESAAAAGNANEINRR
jgi:hypothetical protein